MVFISEVAVEAIENVHVLVSDATFDLTGKPFAQMYSIHGLVS